MLSIPLALVSLLAPALTGAPEGGTFALRATRVHVGDGTVIENGVVVVRDGKIAGVGKGVTVDKNVVLVEHDGDLSPGLIALRDYSGAGSEGADSTRTVMETADLAHAFDPDHSSMKRLQSEGVTTVVLAPTPGQNLIGGLAAAVKPGVRVLARGALLHLDLSTSGLRNNRYPTSYAGAFEELERRFHEPQGVFARVAAGELRVLLEANNRAELQRALAFASRHGLAGILVGSSRAGELAAQVKASGLGIALGPYGPGTDSKTLASAAALARAGVPLGFALDAPGVHPVGLRWTAALCVRAGLERDAAFGALTSGAADLAGIGDRVGRIREGLDADLVLWSGDPVDAGSRVQAVWIDGKKVFEAPEDEDDEEDEDEEEEDDA